MLRSSIQFCFICLLGIACTQPIQQQTAIATPGNSEPHWIEVVNYALLDTSQQLYWDNSDSSIILLNCTTNFPSGTVIIAEKANRLNTTSSTPKPIHLTDTCIVDKGAFITTISPSLVSGNISFRLHSELQEVKIAEAIGMNGEHIFYTNDKPQRDHQNSCNCLFYSEYQIEYEMILAPNSTTQIPRSNPPVLIISKVK